MPTQRQVSPWPIRQTKHHLPQTRSLEMNQTKTHLPQKPSAQMSQSVVGAPTYDAPPAGSAQARPRARGAAGAGLAACTGPGSFLLKVTRWRFRCWTNRWTKSKGTTWETFWGNQKVSWYLQMAGESSETRVSEKRCEETHQKKGVSEKRCEMDFGPSAVSLWGVTLAANMWPWTRIRSLQQTGQTYLPSLIEPLRATSTMEVFARMPAVVQSFTYATRM